MKTASKLLLLCAASALVVPSHAAPSGPSAKSAARLKKYPTSRWLAHYLPDDRYKIAGGVWKYVSTDLDTYYHRPDNSLMLRQPNSGVIGFASAQEAEEAGYRPDPTLRAAAAQSGGTGMGGGMMGGASMGGVAAGGAGSPPAARVARRVILADGTSSIILPAGWRAMRGAMQRTAQYAVSIDQFIGPAGQRLMFQTMTFSAPELAKIDFGRFTTVAFFKRVQSNSGRSSFLDQSGIVNSRISGQNGINQFKNVKLTRANLGGVEGVGFVSSGPRRMPGEPNRSYLFGRGTKMWILADFSTGRQRPTSVIKSLKLR